VTHADTPPARKPTRHDVAVRAGVSDAVVSYALNGGAPVAPATRRRVLDAVAELGYRPNQAARALRSGSARTLVLAVPDDADPVFANPFFAEYAAEIEQAARRRGYALYTTATAFDPETVRARFDEFAARMVDGVLVLAGGDPLDATVLDTAGLPWLELNASPGRPGIASVGTDLQAGARLATAHLLEHGYPSVGFVGEEHPAESRHAGWLDACREAGVQPGPAIRSGYARENGYAAIGACDDLPSALFVASDRAAVGVLRALHERGVRVPEDVALVAFDGTWEAEYTWPALSSVRQPVAEMAEDAVARLLDPGAPRRHASFAGRLVVRASCGPHR
jgi:LacI family transcriptional regulator